MNDFCHLADSFRSLLPCCCILRPLQNATFAAASCNLYTVLQRVLLGPGGNPQLLQILQRLNGQTETVTAPDSGLTPPLMLSVLGKAGVMNHTAICAVMLAMGFRVILRCVEPTSSTH